METLFGIDTDSDFLFSSTSTSPLSSLNDDVLPVTDDEATLIRFLRDAKLNPNVVVRCIGDLCLAPVTPLPPPPSSEALVRNPRLLSSETELD